VPSLPGSETPAYERGTNIRIVVELAAAVLFWVAVACSRKSSDRSEHVVHNQHQPAEPESVDGRLPSGVRVRIRGPITGTWLSGFQIVTAVSSGYVVRRLSDRRVVRRVIHDSDVRLDPIPIPPRAHVPFDAA
jgi:hypothetical protein